MVLRTKIFTSFLSQTAPIALDMTTPGNKSFGCTCHYVTTPLCGRAGKNPFMEKDRNNRVKPKLQEMTLNSLKRDDNIRNANMK